MNAIRFDSKFTDELERSLIRREANVFALRSRGGALAGALRGRPGHSRYANALTALKGVLIVGGVVFVTITFALQAAAWFS